MHAGAYDVFVDRTAGASPGQRETLCVADKQAHLAIVETWMEGGVKQRRVRVQLGNQLGSSLLELDEAGQVISYEEYRPYGDSAYLAGDAFTEVQRKRYRYSGKERDDETGLYYYGARYFAPWMGRWLSPDPLLSPDELNLYAYARGNPCKFVDPDGLQSQPAVDAQASTEVGQPEPTSTLVPATSGPYSVNIDPETGVIKVQEGDWLTKYQSALTGTIDPAAAASQFELRVGDQWVPFDETLDPNKLEVGDTVRFKPWADDKPVPEKKVEPPTPTVNPDIYGAGLDQYKENAKVYVGFSDPQGRGKAFRIELEAGEGGTSLTGDLANARIPIGAGNLDIETPKGALGVYLGRTKTYDNGDMESTYGAEATGSIIGVGSEASNKDGSIGGGASLGVGAGFKFKVGVRRDSSEVKSVNFDMEGKFIGGVNLKFAVPVP
jgi:RHS repeat-associated protein